MKIGNYKLKIGIVVFVFFIFIVFNAVNVTHASQLFFNSSAQDIAVNQQFQVDLMLDSEGEEINALEGKIAFPADLLELEEILDGNSIINFWIERPSLNSLNSLNSKFYILYSGVIPGGFNGVLIPDSEKRQSGKVLSLLFRAKKEGGGVIEINNAKALLNDGNGTAALLKLTDYNLSISGKDFIPDILTPKIIDFEKPESFKPEIARDPNIFGGKWFLVFAAQDKESGIDRYEIQENRRQKIENRRWEIAESPYLLKDQKLKSNIYVKAIDKAGNERTVILQPKYPMKWYEKYDNWIIIIVGVFLFIILYLWRRKPKH